VRIVFSVRAVALSATVRTQIRSGISAWIASNSPPSHAEKPNDAEIPAD
jgi:hypothetical protein